MKTYNYFMIVCFIIFYLFVSCQKELKKETTTSDSQSSSIELTPNPINSQPYKLNIVYFVPNDLDTLVGYKRRISGILIQFQRFVEENMQREGYGSRSFAMDMLNDTMVNIITIRASHDKSYYPYGNSSGVDGPSNAQKEINSYYSSNPGSKKSLHSLIIMPSFNSDPSNPGGPPFYGLGTNCYALDYPNMDTIYFGQNTNWGNLATKWIGGLAHELGHGLNLPHNKELKSLSVSLGTSLMGTGNSTYMRAPTFLTAASCALLSTSQTFSLSTRTDWGKSYDVKLTRLNTSTNNGIFTISGKFMTEDSVPPISKVSVYHDKYPSGGNKDYDALSWVVNPIGTDSFNISCPLSDFYNTTDSVQLRLHFIFPNGTYKTILFNYSFQNNIPNVFDYPNLVSGGVYQLVTAVNNTSVLNISGNGISNGSLLNIWSKVSPASNNQKFILSSEGDGLYRLNPVSAPSHSIDVPGSSKTNGTQLNIWDTRNSDNQKWALTIVGAGYYTFSPAYDLSKNIDVNGGVSGDGTKVQIWNRGTGNSQKWKLIQQ